MDKYKKINGPINIIRIEGQIFGHNKILYLFLDKHYQIQQQTKCQDYLSDDVVVYLNREFHKIENKYIDFFVETAVEDKVIESYDIYKDRYIDEVIKFFYKYIKKHNNKNLGTSISNHIRFHYVDIRNYTREYFSKYFDKLNNLYNSYILRKGIEQIKPEYQLKNSTKIINKLISNIETLILIVNKPNVNDNDKKLLKINYIIDKILNKYQHHELKKYVKDLMNIFIHKLNNLKRKLIILRDNSNLILKIIKDSHDDIKLNAIMKESNLIIDELSHDNIETFCWIMDIYFLRRLLDKDYITHCVAYTGGAHSLEYIYFLVRNFNFKITHASKINGKKNIDVINDELKNNRKLTVDYLWDIFLAENEILQCSDISSFPDNFD